MRLLPPPPTSFPSLPPNDPLLPPSPHPHPTPPTRPKPTPPPSRRRDYTRPRTQPQPRAAAAGPPPPREQNTAHPPTGPPRRLAAPLPPAPQACEGAPRTAPEYGCSRVALSTAGEGGGWRAGGQAGGRAGRREGGRAVGVWPRRGRWGFARGGRWGWRPRWRGGGGLRLAGALGQEEGEGRWGVGAAAAASSATSDRGRAERGGESGSDQGARRERGEGAAAACAPRARGGGAAWACAHQRMQTGGERGVGCWLWGGGHPPGCALRPSRRGWPKKRWPRQCQSWGAWQSNVRRAAGGRHLVELELAEGGSQRQEEKKEGSSDGRRVAFCRGMPGLDSLLRSFRRVLHTESGRTMQASLAPALLPSLAISLTRKW